MDTIVCAEHGQIKVGRLDAYRFQAARAER